MKTSTVTRSESGPSQFLRDSRTGFRWGLIASLLTFACWSQAAEKTNSPEPVSPLDSPIPLELPPMQPEAVEEAPLPAELPTVSPLLPQPEMKNVPPGQALPTQPRQNSNDEPGELLPLPTPRKVAPAPEDKNSMESQAEQFPKSKKSPQWTMLITPGSSSQAGVPNSPRVVTFDLDAKTGHVLGEPREQLIGSDVALAYPKKEAATPPQATENGAPKNEMVRSHPEFSGQHPLSMAYQNVYRSIPYSRAEYLANPAYRHEATMEILFGELRPTTIHKQDTPRRIYNLPPLNETPRAYSPSLPWGGNTPWAFPGPYPIWTPNSTYRRSPTLYGPLFNHYYRPVGRPWGGI